MGHHYGSIQDMVRNGTGGDTIQFALLTTCPDLGPQQAQRHGDEAMVQVCKDNIVTSPGEFVVKDNGTLHFRVGMLKPVGTLRPTAAQFRHIEDLDRGIVAPWIMQGTPLQGRLFGKLQCGIDDRLDIGRGQDKLTFAVLQLLVEEPDALFHILALLAFKGSYPP